MQLSETKADVEAAVVRRMRDEQAALEAEYVRALGQLDEQYAAAQAEERKAAANARLERFLALD